MATYTHGMGRRRIDHTKDNSAELSEYMVEPSSPMKLNDKKRKRMKRVGIVLSGGGAKGAFEVGVLEVLLDKIKKDGDKLVGVAGTSIGAFNGAFVASGQFEVLKKAWLSWDVNTCPLTQYDFFNPVLHLVMKGFMYKSEPLRDFLLKNLNSESLHSSNIKYINTLVRLGDGELVLGGNILTEQNHLKQLVPEIMASMALIPGTPSVEINGVMYADGGFRDTIPVKSLVDNIDGLDKIYVIACNPEKRQWNSKILENSNSSLIERLNFLLNDILWDENNRSDIEIGMLRFWNTEKYVLIYPEFMKLQTDKFDSKLIKEAYTHGLKVAETKLAK